MRCMLAGPALASTGGQAIGVRCLEGIYINDPAKPGYTADLGMQRLSELAALVAEADKVLVM